VSKSILSPKTCFTYSLGCRTNQAEMEEISLQLGNYELPVDLVLLNTCVVTQKAEKETRQKIRELRKKFPKSFLVILGCAVTGKEKFNFKLPQADLFVSNQDKDRVVLLLKEKFNLKIKNNQSIPNNKYTLSGRKFIKIQDGCQNFCSFCLTCHLRGKPISYSPQSIIQQVNFWTKNGIKEIVLTGINLGLYPNLVKLLAEIQIQTKIERISFSSIYPEMLQEDFLKTVINNPRFTQVFHLSLQSGSKSVLKRMNRKTNLIKLEQILNKIKKQNPSFTFRADFIAGFSNETEKEFRETINFIRKTKISFAHVFPYSSRAGTVAGNWPDLKKEIKKQRTSEIAETVKDVRQKEAKELINQILSCLIVRGNEGITENGWPVLIKSNIKNLKGKIIPVKIIDFKDDQLFGEMTSLPTN